MGRWKEIKNNYVDEEECKVYIDAWRTNNPNEEGKIIAKIDYRTKKIEYLDKKAEIDAYAQEVIKETLNNIDNGDYENYE